MTREEFINDITCMSDLMEFCWNEDCDELEYVISEADRDERIVDDAYDMLRYDSWLSVYDMLGYAADRNGYEWYYSDGSAGYADPIGDNEFEDYKNQVLDWAVENDVFDEEEEPEPYEPEFAQPFDEEPVEQEPEVEPEDCSVMDMFSEAVVIVHSVEPDMSVSALLF